MFYTWFVLYGKWRPQGFDEVVGQDPIVSTLRNALTTGKVAHAYLFSGPRGTGKTTTARILARALNCPDLKNGDPCNACAACKAIANGSALDLIEMDAASNRGIEDVRELRDKIAFAPSDLKRKVYLLDEVHMLTDGAFNALLKTIEEPPPHAVFILATTESHKVPATIISRCQRYDFRRVANAAIMSRLSFIGSQEGFEIPDEGLLAIARQSRGGLRDAITLLEQVVAQYGPSPTADEVLAGLGLVHDSRSEMLADAVEEERLADALSIAREVADDGIDIARFTRTTIDELRRRQIAALRDGDNRAMRISAAVAELARADFRLDPASPIPLEIALATAILGANLPAVPQIAAPAGQPSAAARPAPARGGSSSAAPAAGPASTEDRFLSDLRFRLKASGHIRPGGMLNGSCEVLAINGDTFELGFYENQKVHMNTIVNEFRPLIEEFASEILQRPVTLKAKVIERAPAGGARRGPRGGHLAEAARSLGARPIERAGKE